MPEFKERDAEQQLEKSARLAPQIERALQRKHWMPALADDEIPEIEALGRQIVEELEPSDEEAFRSGSGLSVPLRDPRLG
jgi:hypothetical protein